MWLIDAFDEENNLIIRVAETKEDARVIFDEFKEKYGDSNTNWTEMGSKGVIFPNFYINKK